MSSIKWQNRLGYALDSAESSRKPILLDFHDPLCIGCQQMDAVTYGTEEVANLIHKYLIPLRITTGDETLDEEYHHFWTPTVAVLNYKGDELQKSVGFLGPDEFTAAIHLGLAKVHLDGGEFDTAMISLKKILETFPESDTAPEALYLSGVVLYQASKDPGKLKEAYEKLQQRYPASCWSKRAAPYRLL